MGKWEDLQAVLSFSSFQPETSSLFSPYLRVIMAVVLVCKILIHHTSNSTQANCDHKQNGRKATADDEEAKKPKMLSGNKSQGISVLQASLFG